jgi:hypothetical protein
MITTEQLQDPAYAFEVGAPFAARFGVNVDPMAQPQAYDENMYALNPRTAKQSLRFELEGAGTAWTEEDEELVHATAEGLGTKEPEYSFPEGAEYDVLLIAGGARNAVPDRAEFAAQALASGLIRAKKVLVAGDGRRIGDKERQATDTWAPGLQTAFDMADAATDKLRRDHPGLFGDGGIELEAFHLQTERPDQRAAVNELILREGVRRGGRLAVVTTALYVPFKTHKTLAISEQLGVEADVVGTPSRQAVIDARTTDTYFENSAQTLMSAAQHRAATKRLI